MLLERIFPSKSSIKVQSLTRLCVCSVIWQTALQQAKLKVVQYEYVTEKSKQLPPPARTLDVRLSTCNRSAKAHNTFIEAEARTAASTLGTSKL